MAEGKTGMAALIDASIAFRTSERLLQLKLEHQCANLATWAGCAGEASNAVDELESVIKAINERVRPILDELTRLREGREETK